MVITNNREAKDKQIQTLKDALRDTHESLNAWKDACQDYGTFPLCTVIGCLIINFFLVINRPSNYQD